MRSFQSNLAFARACLDEWQEYEGAEPLFWTLSAWPPSGSPPFLQMTVGNLVLALDELRAVEAGLPPADRAALARVQSEWESRWTGRSVRMENKTARELTSRIAQWRAYVADVIEGADLSDYSADVRPRLCAARLLELLGPRYEERAAALAELEATDTILETRMTEGPCVLGAALELIYPPAPSYRFLYRRPRGR